MRKRYKVTWDNTSTEGNFPLSASFNDIDEVYDCMRAMYDTALNVSFDNAELMYKLGLIYSGDLDEFSGEGFLIVKEDADNEAENR